jgi:hypothetical protein
MSFDTFHGFGVPGVHSPHLVPNSLNSHMASEIGSCACRVGSVTVDQERTASNNSYIAKLGQREVVVCSSWQKCGSLEGVLRLSVAAVRRLAVPTVSTTRNEKTNMAPAGDPRLLGCWGSVPARPAQGALPHYCGLSSTASTASAKAVTAVSAVSKSALSP